MFCKINLNFDKFQLFKIPQTILRILSSILLQVSLNKEIEKSVKVLTFLRNQKGSSANIRGKYINVVLCSMQLLAPAATMVSYIISTTQDPELSQIIKTFVTLSFIVNIDDMFAATLPSELSANFKELNKSGLLKISENQNTLPMILRRLGVSFCSICKFNTFPKIPDSDLTDELVKQIQKQYLEDKQRPSFCRVLIDSVIEIITNVYYFIIFNIWVIFFQYFGGAFVIVTQIAGVIYTY